MRYVLPCCHLQYGTELYAPWHRAQAVSLVLEKLACPSRKAVCPNMITPASVAAKGCLPDWRWRHRRPSAFRGPSTAVGAGRDCCKRQIPAGPGFLWLITCSRLAASCFGDRFAHVNSIAYCLSCRGYSTGSISLMLSAESIKSPSGQAVAEVCKLLGGKNGPSTVNSGRPPCSSTQAAKDACMLLHTAENCPVRREAAATRKLCFKKYTVESDDCAAQRCLHSQRLMSDASPSSSRPKDRTTLAMQQLTRGRTSSRPKQ